MSTTQKVNLVIAEMDFTRMNQMLGGLNSNPMLAVVGMAFTPEEAIERAATMKADAILASASFAGMTPVQMKKRMMDDTPGTLLYIITPEFNAQLVAEYKNSGIRQVYPLQSFLPSAAASEIVNDVLAAREEFERNAMQFGAIGKGQGVVGQKVVKEHYGTSFRQTVVVTHNQKGGVGKSVVAANLATAIKISPYLAGARVALLDFDFTSSNIATFFKIPHDEVLESNMSKWADIDLHSITDYELDQLLYDGPGGLKIGIAPLNFVEGLKVNQDLAEKIITVCKRYYDIIVIDGAPNITDPIDVALHHATHVLGIVNPEGQSVSQMSKTVNLLRNADAYTDGYTASDMDKQRAVLRERLNRMMIVINYKEPTCSRSMKPSEITRTLNIPVVAEIPYDAEAVQGALHDTYSNLQAVQVCPDGPFSEGIRKLAHALVGAYPPSHMTDGDHFHVHGTQKKKRFGLF